MSKIKTVVIFACLLMASSAKSSIDGVGCDGPSLYYYKVSLVSVYDGDTANVDIDLGFGVFLRNQSVRFYGIDAPELKGASKIAGAASRDYLKGLLAESDGIILESIKDDREKYGRILGNLWVRGKGGWCAVGSYCLVNGQMVASGNAVNKSY